MYSALCHHMNSSSYQLIILGTIPHPARTRPLIRCSAGHAALRSACHRTQNPWLCRPMKECGARLSADSSFAHSMIALNSNSSVVSIRKMCVTDRPVVSGCANRRRTPAPS